MVFVFSLCSSSRVVCASFLLISVCFMRSTVLLLIVLFAGVMAAAAAASASASDERLLRQGGSNLQNPNMFEISTRPWLYLLSQKYQRNITTFEGIGLHRSGNLCPE
jgi:hypothetical protein